jgi:Ca2+/Na+ antiporter
MLAGVCLPALVLNLAGAARSVRFDLLWLLGMSSVTIALLARRRGLTRAGGAAIIALYVLFVALRLRG